MPIYVRPYRDQQNYAVVDIENHCHTNVKNEPFDIVTYRNAPLDERRNILESQSGNGTASLSVLAIKIDRVLEDFKIITNDFDNQIRKTLDEYA